MKAEREILVDGRSCPVLLSDEREALLAAKAAGRAFVGVLGGGEDLYFAPYVLERVEDADAEYLERVARRHLGLPWMIACSRRIFLREFALQDIAQIPEEETDTEADGIFRDPETLEAYIRHQYRFFEYGLWAVVRKRDGRLLGKVGVFDCEEEPGSLELGYQLFTSYRGRGYAREACRLILDYVGERYGVPLCARVEKENPGSIRLLEDLGFALVRILPDGKLFYRINPSITVVP